MKKVLLEKVAWSNVATELSQLATQSDLGADLFLSFCPPCIRGHVNKHMRELAKELVDGADDITQKRLTALTQTMLDEASRLSMDKLAGCDQFEVGFVDCTVTITAQTGLELARNHVAAALKTVAVRNGYLAQLELEKEIRGPVVVPETRRVVEEMCYTAYKDVRARMDKQMRSVEYKSADDIGNGMESARSIWFSADNTFQCDIEYMRALYGETGGRFLLQQAISELPDGTAKVDYEDVVCKLRKMTTTTAWQFAPPGATGEASSIISTICGMQRGQGPSAVEFPVGSIMQTVGERLAFFCRARREPAVEGEEGELVFGKAALDIKVADVKQLVDSKEITDLGCVTYCMVFSWLFSKEEMRAFNEVSARAYALVVAEGVAALKAGPAFAGSAMEHVVAAHESKKQASSTKREIGKVAGKAKAKAGSKKKAKKA